MPAYAIANLRNLNVNREVVVYLQKIDETLRPYNGRFLVHGRGGRREVVEGDFPDQLIVIEFPDYERAHAWYHSDAYQKIVSLRIDNSEGEVVLIEGVPQDYRASDMVSKKD